MPQMKLFETDRIRSFGAFSNGRSYRYALGRSWGDGERLTFIGVNPSTADEAEDDPTVRRLLSFSKSWGYDGFYVVNLFALVTPHPSDLKSHPDPVGIDNNSTILHYCREASRCVAMWGATAAWSPRLNEVERLLIANDIELWEFGRTKHGHPTHPLYLPSTTRLQKRSS